MLRTLALSLSLLLASQSAAAQAVADDLLEAPAGLGQMVRQDGQWVRLKGLNYNLIQHTTRRPFDVRQLDRYQSWGFNFIRFPINWNFLEPTPGNIDWGYVNEIEQVVAEAGKRGMWVMVSMHQWETSQCYQGDWGGGFPGWFVEDMVGGACVSGANGNQLDFWDAFWANRAVSAGPYAGKSAWEVYSQAWRTVAWRLRNYHNVAGWDVINEPHTGRTTGSYPLNSTILPQFYEYVGTRIRWSDWRDGDRKSHLLFVEGDVGTVRPELAKPNLSNFVLTPHFYPLDQPAYLNRDCAALTTLVQPLLDKASAWGVPMLMGEFGANVVADRDRALSFAKHTSRIVSASGQSWAWWPFEDYAVEDLPYRPEVAELQNNLLVYSGAKCVP
ncbi:glycoside hydrolase family 5 protein [Lysobacter enzymogenes]|uniref:glycoside hydrolase family 5 protein n=1 Tax=Lysobacter enzymogenes TaxID=69 RepID=UPI001A95C6C7|nr:cellulase family glycosylhydrolase [Lysobacter enzymogenes]QQP96180.1 cellulase family glycosylhydrolase [Lysobacter enzymogenes]